MDGRPIQRKCPECQATDLSALDTINWALVWYFRCDACGHVWSLPKSRTRSDAPRIGRPSAPKGDDLLKRTEECLRHSAEVIAQTRKLLDTFATREAGVKVEVWRSLKSS